MRRVLFALALLAATATALANPPGLEISYQQLPSDWQWIGGSGCSLMLDGSAGMTYTYEGDACGESTSDCMERAARAFSACRSRCQSVGPPTQDCLADCEGKLNAGMLACGAS